MKLQLGLLGTALAFLLLPACGMDENGANSTGGSGGTGGGENTTTTGTGGSGGGTSGGNCTAEALTKALDEATEGDVVYVGDCVIVGNFTVPPGVTLEGTAEGSGIEAAPGLPAIVLQPGGDVPTQLNALHVRSNSTAGVIAAGEGEGAVGLTGVTVLADLGIGVGIQGVANAALTNVALTGPVLTQQQADTFGDDVLPTQTATHGLVLVDVTKAALTAVSSGGFAAYGALLVRSDVIWQGGNASGNLGVGVMGIDGATDLQQVQLCNTMQGALREKPAFGGLFTSAEVVTGGPTDPPSTGPTFAGTDVEVCNNADIGLLYDHGASFTLENGMITGNQFGGLVITDSSNIAVTGTQMIEATMDDTLPLGEQGAEISAGDGVQLVRSRGITFTDVTLHASARGGLMIDLGGFTYAEAALVWDMVSIPDAGQFGALCQYGPAGATVVSQAGQQGMDAWDYGILRSPEVQAIDVAIIDPNDMVGIIDPNDIPSPVGVVQGGLAGVIQM